MRQYFTASLVASVVLTASWSQAASFTTLGSFNATTTGTTPLGALSFDSAGNLFGTTSTGGANGGGTVFQVAGGSVTPVASFTGAATSGSFGGLTYDASSNTFYGTTRGLNSTTTPTDGTVFSYSPTTGTTTTLHTFLASGPEGSQLAGPVTLVNGTLYGSTQFGASSAPGSLFTLSGSDKTTFTSLATLNSAQGLYPSGKLAVDAAGNVFGTTGGNGGASTAGSAFQYTATTGTVAALSSFSRFTQGNTPRGGLISDANGDLYGTTTVAAQFGGNPVLFKLSGPTHSTFTALATFTAATTGLPGATNYGSLLMDAAGNLYGTTSSGGAYGFGAVFELVPGATSFYTLYSFTGGADGGNPNAGLVMGADGLLYGTTTTGGANGLGTVFAVVPEPTSLALLGLGAAGLMARRRKGN